MSFGLTDHVRARTHAARAGAGWWRAVFGVASVAIALLLGLPVAATASEQPLGSPDDGAAQQPPERQSAPEPAASRDDSARQRPPEGQSALEPGIGGDDEAADAVEFGDKDAGGRAPRRELAAAASVPRLTRGSPGDV